MKRNSLGPTIRVLWLSFTFAFLAVAQTPETLARNYREKPTTASRAALEKYALTHAKNQNGALALLSLAVTDIEANRPAQAIPNLLKAEKRLPALSNYVNLFLAQAYYDNQQYDEAMKAAAQVQDQPLLTRAVAIATRSSLKNGKASESLKLIRSKYTMLEQPLGELLLSLALESSGDFPAAGLGFRSVYSKYPRSPQATEAEQGLQRLQIALTPDERFVRGNGLLEAGQGTPARIEFEAALSGLSGEDLELAKVRIGAARYNARESTAALQYLQSLKVSSVEADAERIYYAIASARRAKDFTTMEALTKNLTAKYKDSRWWVESFVTIGNQYIVDGDTPQSVKYFARCADSSADSRLLSYCAWKVAFDSYFQRRADAYQKLNTFVERFPAAPQTSGALYYLGRLAEPKDPVTAKSFYLRINESFPNHYYGVLARERLDEAKFRNVTAQSAYPSLAFPTVEVSSFEADQEVKQRTTRAQQLATAALDNYAEQELRHYSRSGGPAPIVAMQLASLASKQGKHDRGIRLIKGTFPGYLYVPFDSAPSEFWKLAYPMPYREGIEKHARSQGLDPFLVAGLIRQESEFNPRALSRVKAHGLMQVMPATGRDIARRLGIKPFTTSRLFEPDVSLQMGTFHFKDWLKASNGQIEVTLAAYNAGKSRADRWLAKGNYREPSEYVENIPFTETREYVQAVIRNADLYRRLYGVNSKNVRVSQN